VATDWVQEIADARLRGVDLMATMSESDWAEYRAQCRATREAVDSTPEGRAHAERRAASLAAQMAEHNAAS
jgi:hypothetical protein